MTKMPCNRMRRSSLGGPHTHRSSILYLICRTEILFVMPSRTGATRFVPKTAEAFFAIGIA